MSKKKPVIYPVVFMICLTIFFTLILSILNEVSAERIQEQSQLRVQSRILFALNIPFDNQRESIVQAYNNNVNEISLEGRTIYAGVNNDQIFGYAFRIMGAGLWGSIESVLAFDKDFEKLLGITFIDHSETPGLGGRIDEIWFQEQFRGLDLSTPINDRYIIFRPSEGGNVDSISGATSTSNAVLNIFNENIRLIIEDIKGGL